SRHVGSFVWTSGAGGVGNGRGGWWRGGRGVCIWLPLYRLRGRQARRRASADLEFVWRFPEESCDGGRVGFRPTVPPDRRAHRQGDGSLPHAWAASRAGLPPNPEISVRIGVPRRSPRVPACHVRPTRLICQILGPTARRRPG